MADPTLDPFNPEARGHWIRLRTLIVLRWIAIAGQLIAITVAQTVFDLHLDLGLCYLAVGASVVANLIAIFIFPENKRLMISDNGIGMTREELIEHLGTMARSGTEKFRQALDAMGDEAGQQLIGEGRGALGRAVGSWSVQRGGSMTAVDASGFSPSMPFAGTWSSADLAAQQGVEGALSVWLSEAAAPMGADLVVDMSAPEGAESEHMTMDAPDWARALRDEFARDPDTSRIPPARIAVYEAPGAPSVLGLWEDDRPDAGYEWQTGGAPRAAPAPAGGPDQPRAEPLAMGEEVHSSVLLERNEDWWRITVPDGPTQLLCRQVLGFGGQAFLQNELVRFMFGMRHCHPELSIAAPSVRAQWAMAFQRHIPFRADILSLSLSRSRNFESFALPTPPDWRRQLEYAASPMPLARLAVRTSPPFASFGSISRSSFRTVSSECRLRATLRPPFSQPS